MKRFFILLLISASLHSEPSLSGYVETYSRYLIGTDTMRWTWNEVRFQIQLEGAYGNELHFYSETRLRSLGFPDVANLAELERRDKEKVTPWSLEMREAYIDIYGFIHPALDLRVGKQQIIWGTADQINPTSNLSPYDLEDFFDFGAKLGTNALRATFNMERWTAEVDFIPVFTPSTLPPPEWSGAFFGTGGIMGEISDTLVLPRRNLSECSEYALKISTTIMDYDVSLSYFHGYDGFPIPHHLEGFQSGTGIEGTLELSFPKVDVIGGDFAGSLWGIGIWGEGALFIPEDCIFKTHIVTSFGPIEKVDTLLRRDEPYLKFVFGGDYTFKNGFYLNGQFVRGFIHERGRDSLNYYFVMRGEKKMLNDKLKITPLGIAVTFEDIENFEENYGIAWIPELGYYPHDNIEIRLGAFILDGKGENIFSRMKDKDELFLRVKLSF